MKLPKIILASQSPRRKELLERCGVPFTVYVTDTDESISEPLAPQDTVRELSRRKAAAAAAQFAHERALIIAADTVVALEEEIFGKPADAEDAFRMLRRLSGRGHSVWTGVSLALQEGEGARCHSFACETTVHFKDLTEEEIRRYIQTGEPFDKAGSYAIQGLASAFVTKIEGDFDNVVGLPVTKVLSAIHHVFGLSIGKEGTGCFPFATAAPGSKKNL